MFMVAMKCLAAFSQALCSWPTGNLRPRAGKWRPGQNIKNSNSRTKVGITSAGKLLLGATAVGREFRRGRPPDEASRAGLETARSVNVPYHLRAGFYSASSSIMYAGS